MNERTLVMAAAVVILGASADAGQQPVPHRRPETPLLPYTSDPQPPPVHSPVVVFTLLLVVFANTAVAERMEKRKIRTTADTGRSPLLDIDETPQEERRGYPR